MLNKFYSTERKKGNPIRECRFSVDNFCLGRPVRLLARGIVTPLNICINIKYAALKRVICNSEYWLHLYARSGYTKTDLR